MLNQLFLFFHFLENESLWTVPSMKERKQLLSGMSLRTHLKMTAQRFLSFIEAVQRKEESEISIIFQSSQRLNEKLF
jgi:hypothetical protein